MADFAAARPTNRADFADRERREVVVQHVRLPRLSFELLDTLLVALGAERRHGHRLGFPTREQARAVSARQRAHFDRDLADLVDGAAVGAHAFVQHHVAHGDTLDVVQELADVALLLGEALLERGLGVVGDAIELFLALLLRRDANGVAKLVAEVLLEHGAQRAGVRLRHQRALGLSRLRRQLVDHVGDAADVRLGEFERLEHVRFGDLVRAAFDHDDVGGSTRDDHVHVALIELGDRRHDHEFAIETRDANAGDRLGERDVRQADRGRGPDQRQHVGIVLLVRRHDGRHDLRFVRECLAEQRADRAVDEP